MIKYSDDQPRDDNGRWGSGGGGGDSSSRGYTEGATRAMTLDQPKPSDSERAATQAHIAASGSGFTDASDKSPFDSGAPSTAHPREMGMSHGPDYDKQLARWKAANPGKPEPGSLNAFLAHFRRK